MKKRFSVEGMMCSACSASVERAVSRLDGMNSVSVNLLTKTMICDYDEARCSDENIIKAVFKAGFQAIISEERKTSFEPEKSGTCVKNRLIISFAFLAVLMYISMGHMLALPMPSFFERSEMALALAICQLILTFPVLYVNRSFFISGWKATINKAPNMDTLVSTGSLAGIIYGIFAICMIAVGLYSGDDELVEAYRHNLYFEASAMILTLVTLGKYFEERSKKKTSDALRGLEKLRPETVTVERDGVEIQLPYDMVTVGDIVILRPGSRAGVDGVIVEGSGSFDMSSLTGESLPVEKGVGDELLSSGLMIDSFVKYRATSVGNETTLSQIIDLVENAAATKAPVAKLADKISRIFVPTVMLVALVTLAVWTILGESFDFALSRALSVLVISCPCALGLATPVAITVSIGRLAGEGVLVKNASWAELMSSVTTVVFDKTGTVTTGKMQVTDVISDDQSELMLVAGSLEKYSQHPLATAITEYCADIDGVEIEDFRSVSGRGVCGRANGHLFIGGNESFMKENGVDVSLFSDRTANLSKSGKTVMYFADGTRLLGAFAIRDTIKASARATISQLNEMGIKTVLLTGDNRLTAEAVANEIGISELIAEAMPTDKSEHIKRLCEKGRVAMVGDGVNDSPSLALADIGISMGSGTDIAIDASDIVLMGSDIAKVARIIKYAHSTLRIVKQNLFWAFIYNILGIPLAAGVLYLPFGTLLNPMFSSFAMSCSSLFVVSNALRLFKK